MVDRLSRKKRKSKKKKQAYTRIVRLEHKKRKTKHRRTRAKKKTRKKKYRKKKAKGKKRTQKTLSQSQITANNKIKEEYLKSKGKKMLLDLDLGDLEELICKMNIAFPLEATKAQYAITITGATTTTTNGKVDVYKPLASKVVGRLSTLLKDAVTDFLDKNLEICVPPLTKKDKEEKEKIWDFNRNPQKGRMSAVGDRLSGHGVGDHMYGVRELVCGTKEIVGSNTEWNRIPCPSAHNVAWKNIYLKLAGVKAIEAAVEAKILGPISLQTYNVPGPYKFMMVQEFEDIFLRLIKIHLNKDPDEIKDKTIPEGKSLAETKKLDNSVEKYMETLIEYPQGVMEEKELHAAHLNFMKFYKWKRYCDGRGVSMYWGNKDGGGKNLDVKLKEIVAESLKTMSNKIGAVTIEEVKHYKPSAAAVCYPDDSSDDEDEDDEVDDGSPMSTSSEEDEKIEEPDLTEYPGWEADNSDVITEEQGIFIYAAYSDLDDGNRNWYKGIILIKREPGYTHNRIPFTHEIRLDKDKGPRGIYLDPDMKWNANITLLSSDKPIWYAIQPIKGTEAEQEHEKKIRTMVAPAVAAAAAKAKRSKSKPQPTTGTKTARPVSSPGTSSKKPKT